MSRINPNRPSSSGPSPEASPSRKLLATAELITTFPASALDRKSRRVTGLIGVLDLKTRNVTPQKEPPSKINNVASRHIPGKHPREGQGG